jgi:multicomponent Na+:H+ antiporter subunit B
MRNDTPKLVKKIVALFVVAILVIGFFVAFQEMPKGTNINVNQRVSRLYVLKNVKTATKLMKDSEFFAKGMKPLRSDVPYTPITFGKSENLEDGAANVVTSIVVDYRGFDTLGEVTVLFLAATGVAMLLFGKEKKRKKKTEPSLIMYVGTRIAFAVIFLFGIYIFVHGHLTPGGGFPGGAVIASGILGLFLGRNGYEPNHLGLKVFESLSGMAFVIIGLTGLFSVKSFLANFLPTGVVGDLYSAGFIALIYIAIGMKVGAELSAVVNSMIVDTEEEWS